jgi:solute carrier family 30 (zinc transporter), member 1
LQAAAEPPSQIDRSTDSINRLFKVGVLLLTMWLISLVLAAVANSMSLVSESLHLLTDLLSLVIQLESMKISRDWRANRVFTFGYQRAEVLGSLFS